MYNYLQSCINEAAKEALREKEDNKGRKIILGGCRNRKERQNKKKLFLKWLSTIQYGTNKNKKNGN
jgi:hypothetical protein